MCDTRNVISQGNVLYFYISTFPSGAWASVVVKALRY